MHWRLPWGIHAIWDSLTLQDLDNKRIFFFFFEREKNLIKEV